MWCRKVMHIIVILMLVVINVGKCLLLLTGSPYTINQTNTLKVLNEDFVEEARKKKKKDNLFKIFLIGAVLVKLIIFPIAVKIMAVMSTISVLLSTMSLIISSIVGYAKVATKKLYEPTVKVIHVNDVWAKEDKAPLISEKALEYNQNVPSNQIHYKIRRRRR